MKSWKHLLIRKQKFKNKPKRSISPFRRKREDIVLSFIEQSKLILKHSKSVDDTPLQERLRRRLKLITYFDEKRYRAFSLKYIKFIKLTLSIDVTKHLDYLISRWERVCMEHGPTEALKIFKDLYNIGCRISTSNTFSPMSFRKSNSRGEPKLLGPLLGLLKGTLNERRAALCVLSLIKVVEHSGSDYSIETILKEAPIKQIGFDESPKVGNYMKRFIEQRGGSIDEISLKRLRRHFFNTLEKEFPSRYVGKRLNDIAELSNIHISGRNGPNGPCLSTAVCDHQAFQSNESSKELYYNIKKMSKITNNERLQELIASFDDESTKLVNINGDSPIHSKISLKAEPWGRLRPFAICDYFSQTSLTGLHTYLFRWLEDQSEDGTYNQDRVSEEVRKWTTEPPNEYSCESADLSAATDSIPIEVQGEILAQIAGQDFAKTWTNIVSNRSFKGPSGEDIKYATGQPMGILSSWAMLAVWHHMMVRTCQAYLNQPRTQDTNDYFIIGDDVAMKGSNLFRVYEVLVRDVQGVGISKLKGFHKETQTAYYPITESVELGVNYIHTAEFAKRIFCNGYELTVVPPNEVLTSSENILQFPEILQSLKKRGYSGYNDITKVSILCETFFLKKKNASQALMLSTCPVKEAPLFTEDDYLKYQGVHPYSDVIWFKPNFNRLIFIDQLISTVMITMSSSVPVTFGTFTKWEMVARDEGERKAKNWVYTCKSQNLLLNLVITECKKLFFKILMGRNLARSFPKGEPIKWNLLKKTLQSFQTIVEIDHVYSNDNKVRNEDRIKFMNSFLARETKKALKVMMELTQT